MAFRQESIVSSHIPLMHARKRKENKGARCVDMGESRAVRGPSQRGEFDKKCLRGRECRGHAKGNASKAMSRSTNRLEGISRRHRWVNDLCCDVLVDGDIDAETR